MFKTNCKYQDVSDVTYADYMEMSLRLLKDCD